MCKNPRKSVFLQKYLLFPCVIFYFRANLKQTILKVIVGLINEKYYTPIYHLSYNVQIKNLNL